MFAKLCACFSKQKSNSSPEAVPEQKQTDYTIPIHFTPYMDEPLTTPYPTKPKSGLLTLSELAPLDLIPLNPPDMDYTCVAPVIPPKLSDAKAAHMENSIEENGTEMYRVDMNGTELDRTNMPTDTTTGVTNDTTTGMTTDAFGGRKYVVSESDSDMELNRPYVTPEQDEEKLAGDSLSFASPYITPGQVALRKVFTGTRYDDFYGPISRV